MLPDAQEIVEVATAVAKASFIVLLECCLGIGRGSLAIFSSRNIVHVTGTNYMTIVMRSASLLLCTFFFHVRFAWSWSCESSGTELQLFGLPKGAGAVCNDGEFGLG